MEAQEAQWQCEICDRTITFAQVVAFELEGKRFVRRFCSAECVFKAGYEHGEQLRIERERAQG